MIILWPSLFTATSFYRNTPGAWQYALALHVFAWYMQIHPGHGIFEGRNAAITDNFWAGLLPGPFFAWFEVLFFFGWNPKLKAHLQVTTTNISTILNNYTLIIDHHNLHIRSNY